MYKEQRKLLALGSDINQRLVKGGSLEITMQGCMEALVEHLDLAFARIWILNESDNVLELLASAGLYTHLNGRHGRVPVGSLKIGRIAVDRKPYLSNSVLDEPWINDKDWARREGMVSFAGHPLLVADRLVGVVAMFARIQLSPSTLTVLATIADAMAMCIEHKSIELKMAHLAAIVESTDDAIISKGMDGIITSWNPSAERIFGYTAQETIGKSVTMLIPKERWNEENEIIERLKRGERVEHYETVRQTKDGRRIDVSLTVSSLRNRSGQIIGASKVLRDISDRKRLDSVLDQAKTDLERRFYELDALNKELDAAKQQAQSASTLKSDFVANMSHEIRTPMNGIIGMSNLLLRTDLDAAQRDYADSIKDAANSLLSIINDILDFSKIEAGRIELELIEFDLVRVVEGVCELLGTQARNKQLSLVSFVDPGMPQCLRGDPERIRQVLINLLSNAIKFTDAGEIVVKVFIESRRDNLVNVRFCVLDEGIGLTVEEQKKLFKPFVQADGSISRRFGGTGLGLSISKHLVEIMNGAIAVKSRTDIGSTFEFTIPLEVRSESAVLQAAAGLRNVRVLVIDIHAGAREILHKYIVSWGMRCEVASSVDEGIRQLRQARFDGDAYLVAIVDLPKLPRSELSDEVDWAELLMTNAIMLTTSGALDIGSQALAIGFKACLTKPVKQSQLLDCLVELVCGDEVDLNVKRVDSNNREKAINQKSDFLILVAEDHPLNQKVARLYLSELGFECHVVNNGKEAIEAVSHFDYALVFMDCQMPEIDGLTATGIIRKAESLTGKHTTIVAITANAMKDDREMCIAAGMDDYISKPINPEELRKIIERWISKDSDIQSIGSDSPKVETQQDAFPKLEILDIPLLLARFDAESAATLLELFLSSTPENVQELLESITECDCEKVVAKAHSLKGACGTIFATQMKALCLSLEKLALSGEMPTPSHVDQLQSAFAELREYVHIHFPELEDH